MKNTTRKSINGYALWIALVCLGFLCQIVGFMSLYTMQNSYLLACQKESKLDLSVISWAREMIDHNRKVRICHLDDSNLILSQKILMDDIEVYIEDKNTYIDCLYDGKEMKIYYDDKNIAGISFE